MRLRARIEQGGESYVVESRPVDVVKWEKGNKRKITDGLGFTDMAQIIHSAARRDGLTDAPFDAWLDQLDDFVPLNDEDPNPPQQEPLEG